MIRHPWSHSSGELSALRTLLVAGLALVVLSACQPGAESGGGVAEPDVGAASAVTDPSEEPASTQTQPEPSPPRPLPSGPDVQGVDVSHHSGSVDWQQVVDAGYDFAYLKATEGVDALDPNFAEHWRTLGEMGVPRGAYHFYVTEDDPEEQARFFLDTVDWQPGDLRPVVDVELIGHGTEPQWPNRLRRFLEIVEAEVGVAPVIYTMPNFWDAHMGDGFEEHPLWVAEYGVSEPRLPRSWERWHLWQHAADRAVPGVEKGADVSRLHPDVDFRTLLIPPAEEPEGPAAPDSEPES